MAEGTSTRLIRSGREPIDIARQSITLSSLARMFTLDPATVWLREEFGSRVFFPQVPQDPTSGFSLPTDQYLHLIVEGNPRNAAADVPPASTVPITAARVSDAAPTPLPGRRSNGAGSSGVSSDHVSTVNVKVVLGYYKKKTGSGKRDFKPQAQTFVDCTEATANVDYIQTAIQRKWGSDKVLCTADGLPIEDSSGTQGFKFWKVGSRKIHAVRMRQDSEDSDSDFETSAPSARRRRKSTRHQDILDEINNLRSSLGCRRAVSEAFRCTICHRSPMMPPVSYARCCQRLLGCKVCVERWASESDTPGCPLCREKPLHAIVLRGLDDLLASIDTEEAAEY